MKIQQYVFVFKMDHIKYHEGWQEEERKGLKVGDMHSSYTIVDGRV